MIYLDHAATTPLSERAWTAMEPFLREHFGNASEPHAAGRAARQGLSRARADVAEALGVAPALVVFTGGGTEADNLAVLGYAAARPGRILASTVEHPAVRGAVQHLESSGREVMWLPVDDTGQVDVDALRAELRPDDCVVCVLWANNVTGVVQPLDEIAALCADVDVPLHADAVQAASGRSVNVGGLPGRVTVALAAHKLGGPKGVGALAGPGVRLLRPLVHGGGQERGLRPGTENVAGAAGLAAALVERQQVGAAGEWTSRAARRDRLEQRAAVPVAGAGAPRLPGHALLLPPDVRGDVLVHVLDGAGICVAAGSACSSGSAEPSHVLTAMGIEARVARSALRVTLGPATTDADVDAFLAAFEVATQDLRLAVESAR